MRILICCVLLLGASVSASLREKRQATYTFPGPRNDGGSRHQAQQPSYRQATQGRAVSRNYAEEQDDPELYQAPRRQYQPQGQPAQYAQEIRSQAAPQPAPVYEAPRAAPQPRQTYKATATTQRKKASASSRANKYGGSAPQQSLNGAAEEEVEEGPDPLTLLLEDSKFTCGGKTDGYYADDSVNCHVFHYCVGGARHSWMCPEGTLFHQVHLNCVPEGQDICAQSEKFHFVNDYLYKPVDYDGPNNTARYAQRYYPDGYVVGDTFATHQAPRAQAPPPAQPAYRAQSYPAPAPRPASRPQHRQVAPAPPPPPPQSAYNAPPQSATYGSQAAAQPHSGYRAQQQQQQQQQQAARASRPSRPTYVTEVQQGYRGNPVTPIPHSEPVSDELYQPEPETRRHATPARTSSGGYVPAAVQRQQSPPPPPPQQQQQQPRYRSGGNPRALARAQYPTYVSNQAAGVQYDEDY